MTVWNPRANAIFLAALDLHPGPDRLEYLDGACSGDQRLRAEVEALIAAGEQAAGFLETPQLCLDTTWERARIVESPGSSVERYDLIEQIGEGGMGIVFLAEQREPVRRKVALKVIKPGMDTRQVIARFETERQVLAMMDHAHIARVLDAGTTATGRPYFAMELVQGEPITRYCDRHRLPVRERLALAVTICQAVEHAHQKGIIHRDIKPSNVLVATSDDRPFPKIIDFGVAKATSQEPAARTLATEFGQLVGTFEYMSPEQAQLKLDVDTRSDIYAVGVLLYELLTGSTPFDRQRLSDASIEDRLRAICEDDPPPPSARLAGNADLASVAWNRGTEPWKLRHEVRGDLDCIVMKAIDKDRDRRFATASALAADLERYLQGEVVQARAPSVAYRLAKFARRNKMAMTALAAAASVVVLALVGLSISNARITRERNQKDVALQQKNAALATARRSELAATEQLFLALEKEAQALRSSGRVGQRFESLSAIRRAAKIRHTPQLATEAAAALVLPDLTVARDLVAPSVAAGHCFSADFERCAVMSYSGEISIYQLRDGREDLLARLPAYGKSPFHGLWMSADGNFLAYGHTCRGEANAAGLRVWRLDGPSPAVVLDESAGVQQAALSFHDHGRRLAVGHADATVSVYELPSGRRIQRLRLDAPSRHLQFHPRRAHLAIACGKVVRIVDSDSGAQQTVLQHDERVTWTHSVAWHPDGRCLATGTSDCKIHIWDTETARETMPPWSGHGDMGISLAFNQAGDRVASMDWSGQSRLWDARTGRLMLTAPTACGLQFSRDDRLLGSGFNSNADRIRIWQLASGRELQVLRPKVDVRNFIGTVVDPSGRILAAGSYDYLFFFDFESGEELACIRWPGDSSNLPLRFDPLRGLLTAGTAGLLAWPMSGDPSRGDLIRFGPAQALVSGYRSAFSLGATTSLDGKIVAVPDGEFTSVIELANPATTHKLGPQYDVRTCAVSTDRRWIATGSHFNDGKSHGMKIWDRRTAQQVHDLPVRGSTSATFSPDGRWLVSRNLYSGCQVWEVATWKERKRLAFGNFMFSGDARLLALSAAMGTIRLFETDTWREIATLTGPEPITLTPACFSPDGTRLLATCPDRGVMYVWNLRLLRRELKALSMDWQWPEFPPDVQGDQSGRIPRASAIQLEIHPPSADLHLPPETETPEEYPVNANPAIP